MFYTLTLNPSLDYYLTVPAFTPGRTNRSEEAKIIPGGKGLNVSILLKNLNQRSIALGMIAGFTGDEWKKRVEALGIETRLICLPEGASRINVKLRSPAEGKDSALETEINAEGPVIPGKAMDELMQILRTIAPGDVLFLSGSLPASLPPDTYARILKEADRRGVLVAADTSGKALKELLPCRPFLVKPNSEELSALYSAPLKTRMDAFPYARRLQEDGARNVLVSMGAGGAILLTETGEFYEAPAFRGEVKSTVGAGDSMLAAFMASFVTEGDYAEAFRLALVAGSATAFSDHIAGSEEMLTLFASAFGSVKIPKILSR